ncbi:aldehyde dehydrogenase family protein, partial [Enterococcus faecalis]|uniref:aldehyde dehydrogenase family protein n=1 Tax=Enterococcus faecalis TaxID=1351 RepID=UPI0019D704E0
MAEKVKQHAEAIKVGEGMGEGVEMGPVISARAKTRIVDLIDDAEKRGAKGVLDGRGLTVPGYENGHFLGPTILDDGPLDAPVYT